MLISIDTLRADHIGAYGYKRETTPHLDQLAAKSLIFTQHYSTSPWTKPSHASMFTGRYPSRHGAVTMDQAISKNVKTLAEHLNSAGFKTSARVNARWLTTDGLERGFTDFQATPYLQSNPTGSKMGQTALKWLDQTDFKQRQFLFLHFMDVHSDYTAKPPHKAEFVRPRASNTTLADGSTQQLYEFLRGERSFSEPDIARLRDLYDAGLHQVDEEIGQVITALKAKNIFNDTLIMVTSDHGEEFLEHGGVLHGYSQFDEVLQIPWIVAGPGIKPQMVKGSTSLIDLMPTALSSLGIAAPSKMDGIAIDLWSPKVSVTPRLLFAEADTVFPPQKPGEGRSGPWRALMAQPFKLYFHEQMGRFKLFKRDQDPGESKSVSAQYPEVAKQLLKALECYQAQSPSSDPCVSRPPPALDSR